MLAPNIITCPAWGARQPKGHIQTVRKPNKIIIHHTAGHHPEISHPQDESLAECIRYAREIQNFHMDTNGWIDSGHNFLVCRNGTILQGRWLTVSAIEAGHMVESAHCPGQNGQVGIEHEHNGHEEPTLIQLRMSAYLIAWISSHILTGHKILPLHPHSQYFATACPANLKSSISWLEHAAQVRINAG